MYTKYFLMTLMMFFAIHAASQNIPREKIMYFEEAVLLLDSTTNCLYRVNIGNDTLAAAFRIALNFFPELCHQKIRLQYGSIKTSMAAQPRIWSIFVNRSNRTYKIIINKNPEKEQTQLLYAAPFNAKVGIMGHELTHILDYSTKSGCKLTWTGVRYMGKKYRRELEKQTDSITIARGLGWQLYHFSYFLTQYPDINEEYRQYKLDTYMKPEEILERLK